MYKKWTKDEEELFLSLYKEKGIDQLADIFNCERGQIISKARRLNVILMNQWSKDDDDFLINNYMSMSYNEIGSILNRSKSAVQARCRKLNLQKMKSSIKKEINSNYFHIIDTEEKAYWLGFICADGCISWNKNCRAYHFKITLQRKDAAFLGKFVKAINGNFDVALKTNKATFNGVIKEYETCEVSFKDKTFTNDLLQYFSPNKTEYLRIPKQIPKELLRHFIRGFSDGDGCFYCNLQKKDKSFEIVGKCYDMLNDIRIELKNNGIYSQIYKKRETNYKLGIYRTDELIKLYSYFYKDATIFMDRKFIKSQEILKLAS